MAKESSYYADVWYPRVKAARAAAMAARTEGEAGGMQEAGEVSAEEAAAAREAEFAKYRDPYDMVVNGGDALFDEYLESRTEEQLRQIIKDNRWIDPNRLTRKWKRERLVEHIRGRVLKRAHMGEVFRNYKD